MVTRAAAELASVVNTLWNALLEVVALEGPTSATVLCSTLQDCRYNVCNNSSAIRPQRMQKRFRHTTEMCSTGLYSDFVRSTGNPFSFFPTRNSSTSRTDWVGNGLNQNAYGHFEQFRGYEIISAIGSLVQKFRSESLAGLMGSQRGSNGGPNGQLELPSEEIQFILHYIKLL